MLGTEPGSSALKSGLHSMAASVAPAPKRCCVQGGLRKSTGAVCKFAFAPHLVTAKFYCVNLTFLSLSHFSVTKLGKNEMKLLKNWKNFRKVCKHF